MTYTSAKAQYTNNYILKCSHEQKLKENFDANAGKRIFWHLCHTLLRVYRLQVIILLMAGDKHHQRLWKPTQAAQMKDIT